MMMPFVRNNRFVITPGKWTETGDGDIDYGYAKDTSLPMGASTQNSAPVITPTSRALNGLTLDYFLYDGDGGYTRLTLGGSTYEKAFFGVQVTNQSTALISLTSISQANPGVVTYPGADIFVNDFPLYLNTSATLPGTLDKTTVYWVKNVDTGANTFELAATQGGASIDTSSGAGSGTHYAYVIAPKIAYPHQSTGVADNALPETSTGVFNSTTDTPFDLGVKTGVWAAADFNVLFF